MSLLYALAKIRIPALDFLMSMVTKLGEETFFIVVGLILYWCFSKKAGRYIMMTGFIGTSINQLLKLICRIPRPWVLDPDFQIVESARAGATGYSFPSGHSQNAIGIYGAVALWAKKRWVKVVFLIIALLIPFSRMYLGVHTPLDVFVGCGISLILILALYKPMVGKNSSSASTRICLWISFAIAVVAVLYVSLFPFPEDMDQTNLQHGIANAWTMLGASGGLIVAFEIDEKFIHFSEKAPLWLQFVKVIVGLALALAIKSVLKIAFAAISDAVFFNSIRYFALVLFAGAFWPWIIEKIKTRLPKA